MFPDTPVLSNFATMPDYGPPPSADYETGPYNNDGCVVENGLCIPDPSNMTEMGHFLWKTNTFGPDYEAWIEAGEVDADLGWLALQLYNTAKNMGYILVWQTRDNNTINQIRLFDENGGLLWGTSLVPILKNGCGLGLETFFNTDMTIWLNDTTGWQAFVTITGLTIPAVGYIGGGAFDPA